MASGTINFTQSNSSGSYIDGKIEWSSSDTGGLLNTSILNIALYVRKGNTDMTLTIPTDGTWKYSLTVDGVSVAGTGEKEASVLEDWVLLYRRQGTNGIHVSHNPNGKKSIDIVCSITAPSGTSFAGHTITTRATVKLDTIDRATKINSLKGSTAYLDGAITALYTPEGSDLFNRRLVYVNAANKLTLIRSTDLGSKPATQQTSGINFSDSELSKIYKLITTTTKVKIRVAFQTYTTGYNTQVGEDQFLEITLTIPAKIAPAASLTITQKNTNAWIAGKKLYVAGLSGVTVGLNYQGADWTTIESRNIIYNGTTYDATALNITALKNAGNIEFTGKVIDSRGRSATATESITVLPYSPPAVTSMSLERGTYDTKWTADDDGEDLRVVFKTTISLSDKGNAYAVAFEIDGTAITPASGATTGLTSGTSCVVYFRGVDSDVSHKLQLTATDSVGKAGAATITVPTAHVTIEFKANGKGIAFGKTSEKDAFECAFPAHFGDAVYITDKITCPNHYALRNFNINCNWADGKAHDMLVRNNDGLTVGLGWTGDAEDGTEHETVLDVRPKKTNFRGTVTAPRGRFTATNDLAGENQNDVALRLGEETGQHIDIDSNEIQAKETPTTPGPLYLNLDGGDVFANAFRIPQIQRGSVRITPSAANTPTSMAITFEKEFSGTPTVIVSPYTAVPGTVVTGVGVNGASKTGCTIWVTRTNTTETVVHWIAIY